MEPAIAMRATIVLRAMATPEAAAAASGLEVTVAVLEEVVWDAVIMNVLVL